MRREFGGEGLGARRFSTPWPSADQPQPIVGQLLLIQVESSYQEA